MITFSDRACSLPSNPTFVTFPNLHFHGRILNVYKLSEETASKYGNCYDTKNWLNEIIPITLCSLIWSYFDRLIYMIVPGLKLILWKYGHSYFIVFLSGISGRPITYAICRCAHRSCLVGYVRCSDVCLLSTLVLTTLFR